MNFTELNEYFRKNALEGPPPSDGMFLVEIKILGLSIPEVTLANIWRSDTDEVRIQAGPWEAFVKTRNIVKYLSFDIK